MGKGSQRRKENFSLIQKNWDDINWNSDLIVCAECGQPRKISTRDATMIQDNQGDYVCKHCNFN